VKSNLLRSYEAAQQGEHSKSFEVAGVEVELPRLSLGRQAKLEQMVRAKQKERGDRPAFSLSTLRNVAAVKWAEAVDESLGKTQKEAGARGIDPDLRFDQMDEKDAAFIRLRLRNNVSMTWGVYSKALFEDFDRELMMDAVAMSLRQANGGESLERRVEKDDGPPDTIVVVIDRKFVDTWLAGDNGNLLETMFLWVTGLAGGAEATEAAEPKSLSDAANKMAGGDTGESETAPAMNSTSGSTPESSED